MLDFVIFAVTFVVVLLLAVLYLYPGSRKRPSTVPGLDPSDAKEGNFPDIGLAGSLHQFLLELHEEHGKIASFWWGTTYTVSIASPELFKEHSNVFDRPEELFMLFEPLINHKCIQYANGAEGRKRRGLYDGYFSYDAIKSYYTCLQKLSEEIAQKWAKMSPDQHIPLESHCLALAVKMITQVAHGGFFEKDEEVFNFKKNYDIAFTELENRLGGSIPEANSERQKDFERARDSMLSQIEYAMSHRKENPPKSGNDYLYLDCLMDPANGFPKDVQLYDALVMCIGGFHTTGLLLTWCVYFLATHEDVQEKLYQHLKEELGDEDMTPNDQANCIYLKQVLDETLRCSVLAPYAARYQEFDIKLGGHIIPKNTPVIHALGVVLQDDDIWVEPKKFDPERFDAELSTQRSTFAFQPFGFSGKRICPGYRLAYAEASIAMSVLCRRFKFQMVPGQVVEPQHGLVTRPQEEIWITVSERK